jgi:hypothetical protein
MTVGQSSCLGPIDIAATDLRVASRDRVGLAHDRRVHR